MSRKSDIFIYNYRHFSRLYAQGERFDMTFTDRYTPFSPEQSLDVHISLTDMDDGDYIVRESIINRRSGSAFDRWVDFGALEPDAMLDMLEVRLLEITRI